MPIATRVVDWPLVTAGRALLDMTAQGSRTTAFDGVHGSALMSRQSMGVAVGFAEGTKDIRHFQRRPPSIVAGPRSRNQEG
jgi:hypothetical protein